MTEIEKFISIWHLTEKHTSIPLSHEKVCGELEALSPGRPGQVSLNILRFSNLVEVNCHGEYVLTLRGVNLRRILPDHIQEVITPEKRTGHEWDRFRKILSYYIDCVHLQERTQNYLASTKINKDFFIPVFGTRWLGDLGNNVNLTIRCAENQRAAMQRLLTRKDDDEEIYIGYPVEAFRGKSDTFYTPIGLIPVDICDLSKTVLEINIRTDEAEINQSYLEYEFPPEERNSIINTILRIHAHDEFCGQVDLRQALPHLEKKNVLFDPDHLDFVLPEISDGGEKQFCNVAMLFVGQPLKFSKTLKRELKYIRDKVSDEVLDGTALAYIFREPTLKDIPPEKAFMPLPFIESNPEQLAAVSSALNMHSSKITGPPGTGKSQVAVNIIANLIFNDKTALFTSKNHKAVEAIFERSKQVLSKESLTLVNFCMRGDQDPNPWYRQDLNILTASAEAAKSELERDTISQVNEAVDRWRHIEKAYTPRNQVLAQYEIIQREYSECQRKMKYLLSSVKEMPLSPKDFRLLKKRMNDLDEKPMFKFSQLWKWLRWKLIGKRKDQAARAFLTQNYRDFWDSAVSVEELHDRFNNYSEIYSSFQILDKQRLVCEGQAKSLPDSEKGKLLLGDVFQKLCAILKDAMLLCRCQKIYELEKNTEITNRLKSIMAFMSSSSSPAFLQQIDSEKAIRAEEGFKLFSKYYPGWATTLLSLTKASPCIPGLFDTVIIDEASQCDPASVVPALFRAKSIVFIGDNNQFPPVIDIKPMRNDFLKTKNKITDIGDQHYDFLNTAAFDLSSVTPVLLKEHFRCAEEIAEYFNDAFYANELHIRTDASKLKTPKFMGYRHAVEWIDIPNSNSGEIEAVEHNLKMLIENNYSGTIGVITPFRRYAEDLNERLYPLTSRLQGNDDNSKILISTANGFQGGERDLILFVLGYNDELTKGKLWYAESQENRYIYNVAVSRARACLIIIGDKARCANSSVSVLKKLAELPRPKKPYIPKNLFESLYEKKLYDALTAAGIETKPQYSVLGRRLDLAYIQGDLKIDIEIDGVHYHTDCDGNRKLDDYYRDLQIEAVGWKTKRFWSYDVRDNIDDCVQQIKQMIQNRMDR